MNIKRIAAGVTMTLFLTPQCLRALSAAHLLFLLTIPSIFTSISTANQMTPCWVSPENPVSPSRCSSTHSLKSWWPHTTLTHCTCVTFRYATTSLSLVGKTAHIMSLKRNCSHFFCRSWKCFLSNLFECKTKRLSLCLFSSPHVLVTKLTLIGLMLQCVCECMICLESY